MLKYLPLIMLSYKITEIDDMLQRITPYVGCGMIYQYVLVTEDALCVEFMYANKQNCFSNASDHFTPHR